MPNPFVVFIDPEKFPSGCVPRVRVGIDAAGQVEPLRPDCLYRFIVLRDNDDLEDLAFLNDPHEPVFGVEHQSKPFAGIAALSTIAGPYQQVIKFNHVASDPVFQLLTGLFSDPPAADAVEGMARQVELQNRLGALLTFVMNEQIGKLGGPQIPLADLPMPVQDIALSVLNHSLEEVVDDIVRDLA